MTCRTTEQRIISHASSCYVLGRSGTGCVNHLIARHISDSWFSKTTAMLFKIFAMEKTWIDCGKTAAKPRQLFVTRSAVLADKVQRYYAKLARSLPSSDSCNDHVSDPEQFAEHTDSAPLINLDEEWRMDLPRSFGDLTDDHFPLFITVEHVGSLFLAPYVTYPIAT